MTVDRTAVHFEKNETCFTNDKKQPTSSYSLKLFWQPAQAQKPTSL